MALICPFKPTLKKQAYHGKLHCAIKSPQVSNHIYKQKGTTAAFPLSMQFVQNAVNNDCKISIPNEYLQ
jgi:hypothetical protein